MTFTRSEVAAYYHRRVPALARQSKLQQWRGPCPIHGGKRANFSVDPETGCWFCFSKCGRGGGLVDLEMELTGLGLREAIKSLFSIVGRCNLGPRRLSRQRGAPLEKVGHDKTDLQLAAFWQQQLHRSVSQRLDRAKHVLASANDDTFDVAGATVQSLSNQLRRIASLDGSNLLGTFRAALASDRTNTIRTVREAMADQKDAERVAALCVRLLELSISGEAA